ncbi:MAG: metal ABC transporter substrate-binding protein [Phycisphaerales bacterium]|nr:MAG: zinc ABC transporter substrate-binding protein [Phycisphaerales bacterium]
MKSGWSWNAGWVALLAFLVACTQMHAMARASDVEPAPLRVVVTVPPLAGLVRPLLAEIDPKAEVRVLLAGGQSAHGMEPTPSDIAAIARCDVLVYVGLNLEPRVAAMVREKPVERRQVVCFAEVVGLQDKGKPEPNTPAASSKPKPAGKDTGHDDHDHDHDHDDCDEHNHAAPGYVDQHLWLDPALVRRLVTAIGEAIQNACANRGTLDDAMKSRLDAAVVKLQKTIDDVDAAYRARLEVCKGRAFVTHHNAFSRLADRYGLKVAATIRLTETTEPTASELKEVVEAIAREKVRAIFYEPQMDPKPARRIAEIARIQIGELDPLGSPDQTSWATLMEKNLTSLVAGLSDSPAPSTTP